MQTNGIMTHSKVETYFLRQTPVPFLDREVEKIPVVMVENYVQLGQLTALRFLEWLQENPEGVAALPTGKTPEYFIKWVRYYFANWEEEGRKGLLRDTGLAEAPKPSCAKVHFVQLDEFFPMDPGHERSFRHYVEKYYLDGFGFDPDRALLLDGFHMDGRNNPLLAGIDNLETLFQGSSFDYLHLRERPSSNPTESLQKDVIEYFDRVCEDYERRIRALGGIGFFLGGIGPDGHVAFNVRGSSHHSATRLTKMNYETMAAAANDLGGIESARRKAVITIGLETITHNPKAVAIIMAAGEAKSKVVAQAIEEPADINQPASALQILDSARFFLTRGAASRLKSRRFAGLKKSAQTAPLSEEESDKLVLDGALGVRQSLRSLATSSPGTERNPQLDFAVQLTQRPQEALAQDVLDGLLKKIQAGLRLSGLHGKTDPESGPHRFLHTGPHHDDIELAYFPLLHHLVRSENNYNHFCYLTSGFTSVTNRYLLERLMSLKTGLQDGTLFQAMSAEDLGREEARYREIYGYLNAIAERDPTGQAVFTACRLYRFFRMDSAVDSQAGISAKVLACIEAVKSLRPGQRETVQLQQLKGWLREWEAELVWAHFGFGPDHVSHLRLKFYDGALFPQDPEFHRDVLPIVALLEKVRPTVVTLALDPEGSGPDTHYKVLLAVTAALETYTEKHGADNLRVWGYRNVWARFHAAEVNTIIPVSLNSFAVLQNMFQTCFTSQKSASFPSPELDGTFSELCQKTWVEQFKDLTGLLGKETFYGHAHPMMRRAYGAIYLKDMSYAEFRRETEPLRALTGYKRKLLSGSQGPGGDLA